jgi:hypothetical protein
MEDQVMSMVAGTGSPGALVAALVAVLLFAPACSGAPESPADPQPRAVTGDPAAPTTTERTQPPELAAAEPPAISMRGELPGMPAAVVTVPYDRLTGNAEIVFGVLAGASHGRRGLALLAVELLVEGTEATKGRISLRESIARMGGSVVIEVGPLSTWISVRVPVGRWREALRELGGAILSPTTSRSQLERIRQNLITRRTNEVWNDPIAGCGPCFLLGDGGTGQHLGSLRDRDPSEALLFISEFYRPSTAVIALHVPAGGGEIHKQVALAFSSWPAESAPRSPPDTTRVLHDGLYWAKVGADDVSQVRLFIGLPNPLAEDAPDLEVLLNCITNDGLGARFERMQIEHGLADVVWQPHYLRCAEASALVLTATTTPARAVQLWQLFQAARRSLTDVPPSGSEIEVARARAALTMYRDQVGAIDRVRALTVRRLRGLADDVAMRRLEWLAEPGHFDVVATAQKLLALPAAMVVVGGAIPESAQQPVHSFELLPLELLGQLAGSDPQILAAAALPWVQRAVRRIGAERLGRLQGFRGMLETKATTTPGAGVEEAFVWQRDGTLLRSRRLLGTTIVTSLTPEQWVERAGDQQVELSQADRNYSLRQLERHPLALLAAAVRGEIRFRMVATRKVADRELVVLEADSKRFDRLRLHIDSDSDLVRTVESWETTPEGVPQHIEESWSDYRNLDNLRVPFFKSVTTDDGQSRTDSTWFRFEAILAPL